MTKISSPESRILNPESLRRYARHIVLPEIGEAGQQKLLASSVLVIGAGGLGSAALATLAASGIGRLGIVEPDRVELSNLHRQIVFETSDIGRAKSDAARDRIEEVNPDCKIECFPERLTENNARKIISTFFSSPYRGEAGRGALSEDISQKSPHPNPPPEGEGIVLDCSDNFATRFALADACTQEKKPLVSAAISAFAAQLSTFKPYLGAPHPCYRCFIPDMPEREITCAQEGIIGPLAAMMGSMQALEAIKEILGIGESMSGRLLVIDALTMHIKTLALPKDPACRLCHPEA